MNKDAKNPEEDWQGSLASRFEEDIQLPPDKNWNDIQQDLFPTKKRRFASLWITVSILLGGIGIFFFQRLSKSDNKINAKNEIQNKEIRPKISENNSNNNAQQKVVLTEKDEKSERLNPESNFNNQFDQSLSNQRKNRESTSSENRFSNSKNKSDNSTKSKRKPSKKQNQTINISEGPNLTTEINSDKTVESKNHENSDNETIANTNISSKNARIQDSNFRLKLLAAHSLSTVQSSPIQEVAKKDKTDFKPYFSVQVAPLIGRNIRIVSGTFNSDNTNTNALGERRSSLPKFGFHASLNYHFHKRLYLNTGFQLAGGDIQSRWFFKYLEIDPTTNDVRLKTTTGEASTTDPTLMQSITNGTTGIYKLRLNHSFSLYSLPVGITYRFTDERFSPYFRTGLNMEFFGKRTLSIDVMENGITRNVELSLNRLNNRLNLQIMLALGVETQLKSNWNIFAEAGYYAPLNQFVNSNGYAVRMAGSSILGGVRYDFRKRLIQGNKVTP
jgi:hypothetical protein